MSLKSEEEINAIVSKYYKRVETSTYKGYVLPTYFGKILKDIEDLEVYEDDVWVCSFPKCGTTWTQEMVWCICNNLDFDAAMEDLAIRFVFLELSGLYSFNDVPNQPDVLTKSVDVVKIMKRPRFIKTHLPWELLPKQIQTFEKRPKIVHVLRNPMDAALSFYHFTKLLGTFTGEIDDFLQLFLNDKVIYMPFLNNVLGHWERRHEPNIHVIKFEDMKADLSLVVDGVAAFFNVTLPIKGKAKLLSHLSFDSMKKNSSTDHGSVVDFLQKNNEGADKNKKFMRSGKSGGYRTEMPQEMIEVFKKQYVEKLEEKGLKFSL